MKSITINKENIFYKNIFYINESIGHNNNLGTKESPLKTLEEGMKRASKDDAIVLDGGTFNHKESSGVHLSCDLIGSYENRPKLNIESSSQWTRGLSVDQDVKIIGLEISHVGGTKQTYGVGYKDSQDKSTISLYNCVLKEKSTTWGDTFFVTSDVNLYNCVLNFEVLTYRSNLYDLINCVVHEGSDQFENEKTNIFTTEVTYSEDNWELFGDSWMNSGTGFNPDGYPSHIGVYGGKYAWDFSIFNEKIYFNRKENIISINEGAVQEVDKSISSIDKFLMERYMLLNLNLKDEYGKRDYVCSEVKDQEGYKLFRKKLSRSYSINSMSICAL